MANDITGLRDILFEELRSLGKDATSADIERAKAKSDIAQTIINSAKVEIDFMKQADSATGTGFIPEAEKLPNGTTRSQLGVTVHKLGNF